MTDTFINNLKTGFKKPSDLLEEEFPHSAPPRSMTLGQYPLDRSVPESRKIAEAAQWIAKAKRLILIAGGGVHLSGAAEAVNRLSESAAIPVASPLPAVLA